MFSTLIIDDEPAARRIMRSMLSRHIASVNIIGEAANGIEAVEIINKQKPDLIFLDIQMPGYTGFEVLQKLTHIPNIIFTTAYEEYALKAFESFSVDYLMKPIRQERLDKALEKLQSFGRKNELSSENLKNFLRQNEEKKPTAFPVKIGDRILLFGYDAISHFEADDKYVALFTVDGKKYLTDHTLTGLLQKLPLNFIRVQKSYIINKDKIQEIHKHFNGRFVIIMADKMQSRIISGLTFYEAIKEELGL
ncbi:MAG TPA: response regulator [Chitinophagaceae bacterium]|nr:response regulator [Chitinophagaceae bacterium]